MVKIKTLFNLLGFSFLLAVLLYTLLMFFDIYTKGVFVATETNLYVLSVETSLAIFSIAFCLYNVYSILTEKKSGINFVYDYMITEDDFENPDTGVFKCPKCSNIISPTDFREEKYSVLTYYEEGGVVHDILLQCKKCGSVIWLQLGEM